MVPFPPSTTRVMTTGAHPATTLRPIFDKIENDIDPAAGLLGSHVDFITSTRLVLGRIYPFLPQTAPRQYESLLTCFAHEGFTEPLNAI